MPPRKSRYTYGELIDHLEELSPGISDSVPSASTIQFWTDNTAEQNEYVIIGHTSLHDNGQMRVRFKDNTGSKMSFFNIASRHPETIAHENNELSRLKTKYIPPFDRILPIQYEYPGSSFEETRQWFTELRALTMFVLLLCDRRDDFFDFNKGEGIQALLDVLKRLADMDDVDSHTGEDAGADAAIDERCAPSNDTDVPNA